MLALTGVRAHVLVCALQYLTALAVHTEYHLQLGFSGTLVTANIETITLIASHPGCIALMQAGRWVPLRPRCCRRKEAERQCMRRLVPILWEGFTDCDFPICHQETHMVSSACARCRHEGRSRVMQTLQHFHNVTHRAPVCAEACLDAAASAAHVQHNLHKAQPAARLDQQSFTPAHTLTASLWAQQGPWKHQPLAYTAISLLMWSTDAFLLFIDVDELLLIPKPEQHINDVLASPECGQGCVLRLAVMLIPAAARCTWQALVTLACISGARLSALHACASR